MAKPVGVGAGGNQRATNKRRAKTSYTVQAPIAGVGASRISVHGICQYLRNGNLVTRTVAIPKRQAWSDYRMGGGQSKGLFSVLNEYKTKKKAKKRYKQIRKKLRSCDQGPVVANNQTTYRMWYDSVSAKKGSALGVFQSWDAAQDTYSYVVVHRYRKALSFVRYTETKNWFGGPPTSATNRVRKATRVISNLVINRY